MEKLVLVFSICFLSTVSWANVGPSVKRVRLKVNGLKAELAEKNQRILKSKAKIERFEKMIVKHHNDHARVLKELGRVEEVLKNNQSELDLKMAELFQDEKELKSLMANALLSEENSIQEAIRKKIIKDRYKKVLLAIKNLKLAKSRLIDESMSLNKSLHELKKRETILISLIEEMELDKQEAAKDYLVSTTEKGTIEKELTNTKIQLLDTAAREKKIVKRKLFRHPVNSFDKMKKSRKGVTYQFAGDKPLYAVKKGRVAYTGELGSYGQVIMIDHGKDIRSVLLGNIRFKIKKGDTVNSGDLLGYTKSGSNNRSSLYFEIRKANKAQNTYKLVKKI